MHKYLKTWESDEQIRQRSRQQIFAVTFPRLTPDREKELSEFKDSSFFLRLLCVPLWQFKEALRVYDKIFLPGHALPPHASVPEVGSGVGSGVGTECLEELHDPEEKNFYQAKEPIQSLLPRLCCLIGTIGIRESNMIKLREGYVYQMKRKKKQLNKLASRELFYRKMEFVSSKLPLRVKDLWCREFLYIEKQLLAIEKESAFSHWLYIDNEYDELVAFFINSPLPRLKLSATQPVMSKEGYHLKRLSADDVEEQGGSPEQWWAHIPPLPEETDYYNITLVNGSASEKRSAIQRKVREVIGYSARYEDFLTAAKLQLSGVPPEQWLKWFPKGHREQRAFERLAYEETIIMEILSSLSIFEACEHYAIYQGKIGEPMNDPRNNGAEHEPLDLEGYPPYTRY